jgi:membrane-bound lytic murein transglycosylase D
MTPPLARRPSFAMLAALLATGLVLVGCATGPAAPEGAATASVSVPAAPVSPSASAPRGGNTASAASVNNKPAAATTATPAAASTPGKAATPAGASSAPIAVAATAASAPASAASSTEPVVVAVDPLRPDVRLDLDDRAAQTDLWTRLRAGFAIPDLTTSRVRDQERAYSREPEYVRRMADRGSRYLFHIVEELDKRGMPMELALLPIVESAFNPEAMSHAKASGMWQFMPATGRVFDLTQNVFRDDRRDVLASTRAALDYLQKLHGMFGDWHLALAAYNWGEGSVRRAISRNRAARLPTDYSSLRMPRETAFYVPKLQAVKNIIARPADFGIVLPPLANHPYFLAVAIERDIDVDMAARLAGLPADEFRALNPQMNRPVILAAGTPRVLLPYDNANQFVRALPMHPGPLATWTAWVVKKTMRPADAAKEVGMSEAELREVNRIPPNMLVQAGSTLLVPRGAHGDLDVSEHVADNAIMALAPDGTGVRKVSHRAGKRDTVASVARRYRVSAEEVAHWNSVGTSTQFRRGQTVLVYVASKAPAAKASTTTGTKTGARNTKVTSKSKVTARPAKSTAAARPKTATAKPAKPTAGRPTARTSKD